MCTGDNLDTAIAISLDAGIITQQELLQDEQGYLCMTGKNFREAVGNLVTKTDPVT
jgi:magnesium-transporting ATPase (P-type)